MKLEGFPRRMKSIEVKERGLRVCREDYSGGYEEGYKYTGFITTNLNRCNKLSAF